MDDALIRRFIKSIEDVNKKIDIILNLHKPSADQFIPESEAKQLLNVKDYRTARNIAAKYGIRISGTGNRNIQYSIKDIQNYLIKNSSKQ